MNKTMKRILTLAMVAVMMMALAVPVLAEHPETLPVDDSGKVQFDKKLITEQYAVLPANLEFTFTLTAVSATTVGTWDAQTSQLTGVTAAAAYGVTATEVTYDNGTIKLKFKTGDNGNSTASVTTTKGFVIDFTGIIYKAGADESTPATGYVTKPGVYRYQLTETAGDVAGVTYNSENNSYYIDVFVQWNTAGTELEIANIVVLPTNSGTTYTKSTDTEDGKDYYDNSGKKDATPDDQNTSTDKKGSEATFENKVTSPNLTVSKTVTGNQGDKSKEFSFTVTITGNFVNGQKYHYKDASGTVQEVEASGGQITLTNVKLTNGKSIEFLDLPYGAKASITESDADGYTTSFNLTGGAAGFTTNATERTAKDETTGGLTTDGTVAYTNNKDGTIPTGVLLTIAPFAVLMLVGLAGATVILKKKHE